MDTLIFDFDGTLADSFSLMLEIAYRITGIGPLTDEEVARLRRFSIMKVRKELHIPLRKVPRLVTEGRHEMRERIGEVTTFAGIADALEALHSAGHRLLVMSSNSEDNVRAFLRKQGLERYFDAVYGGVGVFDKASSLRKVLRANRLDKRQCWYVGDEVRDIIAAHKVGVRVVSVDWGYQDPAALAEHKPDVLIHQPHELVALFARRAV